MAEEEKETVLVPVERTDLAQAGDINLGLTGKPTWAERGRLWAHQQLAKAQAAVLDAKRHLNEAATAFLRSQEGLQEEIERNQHWKANLEVIRARIRDEFNLEEQDRKIKRLQRELQLAELELEVATAAAKLDEARQHRRAKGDGRKQETASPSAEEAFRRDAEQILKHGAAGRFIPIAEEFRSNLIEERGGEHLLTDEDLERIELIFEMARRQQESKG